MAVKLIHCLAVLVAICRFPGMGVANSRSLRSDSYVTNMNTMQHFVHRSAFVSFLRFLEDVRQEFMQRLFAALHGTLGSYLRDALHEGGASALACYLFLGPRQVGFFLLTPLCLMVSKAFSCKHVFH
jgi:hypothetical protein